MPLPGETAGLTHLANKQVENHCKPEQGQTKEKISFVPHQQHAGYVKDKKCGKAAGHNKVDTRIGFLLTVFTSLRMFGVAVLTPTTLLSLDVFLQLLFLAVICLLAWDRIRAVFCAAFGAGYWYRDYKPQHTESKQASHQPCNNGLLAEPTAAPHKTTEETDCKNRIQADVWVQSVPSKDSIDKGSLLLTAIIAVIGVLGLLISGWNVLVMRRQFLVMRRQVDIAAAAFRRQNGVNALEDER